MLVGYYYDITYGVLALAGYRLGRILLIIMILVVLPKIMCLKNSNFCTFRNYHISGRFSESETLASSLSTSIGS